MKLRIVAECESPGGFLRVTRLLAAGLARRFDVEVVAFRGPADGPGDWRAWWPGADPWALPEGLAGPALLHGPLPAVVAWARQLDGPLLAWPTVEGPAQVRRVSLDPLRGVVLVAQTRSAAQWLAPAPVAAVIPNPVETSAFQPLVRRGGLPHPHRTERARALLDRPDLQDTFVVLNANRNHARKRIDRTIEGFARFAEGKPDARLYLHMGTAPGDRPTLAELHGVADRVVFSHRAPEHPAWSDTRLGLLYNACDVGLNTSAGEGFGLVAFEHAATGAPQVLPDLPTLRELWGPAALYVAPTGHERWLGGADPVLVQAEAVAAALEHLYADRARLRRLGLAAWRRAHAPTLEARAVTARWSSLIRQVVG